ncbi:MAG: oligosaccharide flippase family protein [Planctomycetia bacterium]
MFPSLLTVALLGCCSSLVSLSIFFPLASRIAPETTRPTLALAEVPALVRCGFWITLSRIVSMMTAGVDDLVITSTCGSAALPPWTICKRAVGTVHAFLAQHVEHLIPTLGSLRQNSQHTFDRLNAVMHWYIVLMAAVSYSCLAWAGPMLIATIAGEEVAQMSRFGLLSVCLNGLAMSLIIMPVISAMAVSDTRPNFILGLLNNVAVLSAIVLLARTYGAPAVYVAAVAVVPSTIMAVGISPTRLFDPGLAWTRIAPVLVPLILGLTAIVSTLLFPSTFASMRHAACGAALAPLLLLMTLGVERTLGMNAELHRQFFRMIRHVLETAGLTRGTMKPAQAARGLD